MLLTAPQTLGADLRTLRKARGLTLQDMADAMGRSVGWLSQIERDISFPGRDDLAAIAQLLDVSVAMLERRVPVAPIDDGFVVRAGARRPIDPRVPGLVEGLLSPDLTDDFEVVHSTFAPGSHLPEPISRPTQEVGYLLSGRLELEIDGRQFTISPGDSFRIRGEPFRWANPHTEPAVAIWIIAPPVY